LIFHVIFKIFKAAQTGFVENQHDDDHDDDAGFDDDDDDVAPADENKENCDPDNEIGKMVHTPVRAMFADDDFARPSLLSMTLEQNRRRETAQVSLFLKCHGLRAPKNSKKIFFILFR